MNWFSDHYKKEIPEKPQTYWEHGWFAFKNSAILTWAGIAGMIHAVFPPVFKFYTAKKIIEAHKKLEESGRHDDLLDK